MASKTYNTDPSNYYFNHSNLRVKDLQKSLDFYIKVLGFEIVKPTFLYNPEDGTTLTLIAYNSSNSLYHNKGFTDRQGVLELAHTPGKENDPDFKYNNGNSEPYRGFGHICLSVDNIKVVEHDLLEQGNKFQKKLSDGRQKDIAFVLDPDGYWIELIENYKVLKIENKTDKSFYRFNHTMIRVKNIESSLNFYKNLLGMKVFNIRKFPNAKFDLYFLGYPDDKIENFKEGETYTHSIEGLLELTYNYGSENDENVNYHNGNDEPKGFGHTAIGVDNAEELYKKLKDNGVKFPIEYNAAPIKGIAFAEDPDGYWIELIPRDFYKN